MEDDLDALVPVGQRLHSVHDRTVQSVGSLYKEDNTHPSV